MLVTMGFGWWLQRREAMQIAHMIEDGNKRLELILSGIGKDVMDLKASLSGAKSEGTKTKREDL